MRLFLGLARRLDVVKARGGPVGTVTTRRDGSQWKKVADPSTWKQVTPPRHPADTSPDQVGPVHRRMSLDEVEAAIAGQRREIAVGFAPDGRQVSRTIGPANDSGTVRVPRSIPQGCVVTHNHPRGFSLSPADIVVALQLGTREMRVATPDGSVFVLLNTASQPRRHDLEAIAIGKLLGDEVEPAVDRAHAAMVAVVVAEGGDLDRDGPKAKGYSHELWTRIWNDHVVAVFRTILAAEEGLRIDVSRGDRTRKGASRWQGAVAPVRRGLLRTPRAAEAREVLRVHQGLISKANGRRAVEDVAARVSEVVTGHHDAWRWEVFGAAAGLTPERVAELRTQGYLGLNAVPMTVAGTPGLDHHAMALLMGTVMAGADPTAIHAMRSWSLEDWAREVAGLIDGRASSPPDAPPGGGGHLPPPPSPPGSSGGGPPAPIPAPPPFLTPMERESWIQARTRGAEYCRGLGNVVDDQLVTKVREVWDGEDVALEADEELRVDVRERVRTATADAVARHKSAQELASDLGHATGDWSRNWDRIATTELQGAYNEGVVVEAIRFGGPEVRIARIPEPGACEACRGAFLDGEGRPRIFTAEELINNGTNVGRKRADWQPTLWPQHPNCACDTQEVPDGLAFNDAWEMVPLEDGGAEGSEAV